MAQIYNGINSTAESPALIDTTSMWEKSQKAKKSSLRLALMHPHQCSQRQEGISLSIDAIHQTHLIFSVKMLS